MVQSKNILSLLVLPTLALCAPSRHAHAHAHHHKREGAVKEHWVYTTEITHVTVYGNPPQAQPTPQAEVNEVNANVADAEEKVEPSSVVEQPLTIQPSQPPAYTQPPESYAPEPTPEVEVPEHEQPSSGGGYPSGGYPSGGPGKFTIMNKCDYDLTMNIEATLCGEQIPEKKGIAIKAGSPWVGNIVSCKGANPTYKIYNVDSGSKSKRWLKDPNNPVQMEVGHDDQYGGTLWYNLSLKDCMTDETGNGIENCAGGPWSLTADSTAGNKGACQSLSCSDKETCCKSNLGAYCDATASINKAMSGPDNGLEPVGAALGTLDQVSIVGEFCA